MGLAHIYHTQKEYASKIHISFMELNKRLKHKPFPIPKISDILQKLQGFQFATALDLNMMYYTIRSDPTAYRICTIVLPWGNIPIKDQLWE